MENGLSGLIKFLRRLKSAATGKKCSGPQNCTNESSEKKPETMTERERQARQIERNRQAICTLCNVTPEQINEVCFEHAYAYLEKVIRYDKKGIELLPQTAQFWTWWKMEWYRIDKLFLDDLFGTLSYAIADKPDKVWEYYLKAHRIEPDNEFLNMPQMRQVYWLLKKAAGI